MDQTKSSITNYLDKNFWNRGEGIFGKVLMWGAGIGVAVAGTLFFGPFVVLATSIMATILANILNMAIAGVVLFAIGYALSDPKFRGIFGFGYRTLIRMFWARIVDMSPKAVLDDILDGFRQNFQRLQSNVKGFSAKVKATSEKLKANEEAMNHSLKLAQKAKQQGKQADSILHAREAERYKTFNNKLSAYYTKMEVILRVLLKVREGAEFSLKDTESRVKFELMEHADLTDAAMAVSDAMKIIKGDSHKNELFNMAMEKLANEKAAALSEMEDFMETSETFFSSVDLEKAIADENAFKLLEEWERKMDSTILGPGVKQGIVNAATDPSNVISNVIDVDEEVIPSQTESKRLKVGGPRSYFKD